MGNKRPPGRPKVQLTREVQDKICNTIAATGCSIRDACNIAGFSGTTLYDRMAKAKKAGRKSKLSYFLDRLDEAQSKCVVTDLTVITAAKDPRWSAWRVERKRPNEFAQRVKIQVESELNEALDRIENAFGSRPDLCEEILLVLGGSGTSTETSSEEDARDSEGGEGLLPPRPQSSTT